MKIVYMGTPDFAVPPLESLMNDGHDIPVVFTQPDRPSGRGMKLNAPAVKRWAAARGISVCQPETMGEALPVLEEISPDLIVVCAYGKIIPETILKLPPYGCVNIHASLLPKYRGAAPIQRCIVDGETVSGVTTMHMAKGLDTGDMIFKEETAIAPDDTGGDAPRQAHGNGRAPHREDRPRVSGRNRAPHAPKRRRVDLCPDNKEGRDARRLDRPYRRYYKLYPRV
ncbi:methionyl-tRNA formyltransferase [Oscillospiraceae bacterium OttesenSCG-928-G22]|nr:methionyl-tRNA formyltransferase [Oscillospiraceae bacterium OttesenSCG-928-G22]